MRRAACKVALMWCGWLWASLPALAQQGQSDLYLPFPEQTLVTYKAIAGIDPKVWAMTPQADAAMLAGAAAKMPKRVETTMRTQLSNSSVRNLRSENSIAPLGDGFFAMIGRNELEAGGGDTRGLSWAGYFVVHNHAHVSTTAPGGANVEGTVVRKLSEVKSMTLRLSEIKPGYKWSYDFVYTLENLLRTKTALFTRGPNATKRTSTQKSDCLADRVVPASTIVEGATGNAVLANCDSELDGRLNKSSVAYLEDYAWFVAIRTEIDSLQAVTEAKIVFLPGN
jgi:hypothetical protein